MLSVAVLLLAAGASTRMGKAKQFLEIDGKPILQKLIQEAARSSAGKILVVTGFESERVEGIARTENAITAFNNEWKEGLGSSIRTGIKRLIEKDNSIDAAILMYCDQPFVTSELIDKLIDKHIKTGKPIVATAINHLASTPVLFHQSMFPELIQLTGDSGPLKLLDIHKGNLVTVTFPGAQVDIDTASDYASLEK